MGTEFCLLDYEIEEKEQLLHATVACRLPRETTSDRWRLSLLFQGACESRYFPVTVTCCGETASEKQYQAEVCVQLKAVFFRIIPQAEENVRVRISGCDTQGHWRRTKVLLEIPGHLFRKEQESNGTDMAYLSKRRLLGSLPGMKLRKKINYVLCTLLLPLWILDGVLAQKGLRTLHPAAAGRTGKKAAFYHAQGLVKDWTGYGYSMREYKTAYFRKCYQKACRQKKYTEGILFLSERRVEAGGNLDVIRTEVQRVGYPYQEFLTVTPIHRLHKQQIRECAEKVAAAKLIVLEDFFPQLHALELRRDTQVLQLWHACGAFKLFGLSELGIVDHLEQTTGNHRCYTAALASSESVVPYYSEAFGIDERRVYPIGVPRTDVFFQKKYAERVRQHLLEKYPVCRGKKVVLIAPTFRGSGNKTAYYPWDRFPWERILKVTSQDTIFLIKNHPFVKDVPNIPATSRERVLDLSETENINDLLFLTDMLVTDYSSVIFEAVLLGIPMLFYAFDLQEYLQTRDLYFDFASMAPGRIVTDAESLCEAAAQLTVIGNSSEAAHAREPGEAAMKEFREFFLGALDGHSTQRTMQLVREMLERDD